MKLNDLLLKKEELPIIHGNCFHVPIHPKLLNENIKINEDIAIELFPIVAKEWYEDLTKYIESDKVDNEEKEHIKEIYLSEKQEIIKSHNSQLFMGYWEDDIRTRDNGFVSGFSINRNAGGSLYFNKEDTNCETVIPGYYLKFSKEKAREFEKERMGEHSLAYIYASHNIDNYPGALFLRNWAIKYMNEVFKQIF